MTLATISNLKGNGQGIDNGKVIIEKALNKKGFTYKESHLKDYPDILIKELSDIFIIGQVLLNENKSILGINFQLYRRNKYIK
jgi:hypothetical protein